MSHPRLCVLSIGLIPGDVIICTTSLPILNWQSVFGLNLLRAVVKSGFVNG